MWRLLLFCVTLAAAEPHDTIRHLLSQQAGAWNRGDIPGFMQTYSDSPDTAYVGASGVTKGYAQVLARYRRKYANRGQMGTLRFSDLDIRTLTAEVATVTGRFHLTRNPDAGGNATGWFTLVLHKTPAGWKIVHDHTS